MAKITMELIKQLREETQVGMMDCKAALIQAEGDIERAIEILRKKGASVAAKRAGHETNNGRIASYISKDGKIGAMVAIGCETDFSANTAVMQSFADTVCEQLANIPQCCKNQCDVECLLEQKLFNDPAKTIKILLDELIAKISENIVISRCARFAVSGEGLVNTYLHAGATLGTMIELSVEGLTNNNRTEIETLAKDICMQIAVTAPLGINPEDIDQAIIEKEKSIFTEQLKASGKPADIIEKILVGKISKYYEEVCLANQKYIKQDKLSIVDYIKTIEKKTNTKIKMKRFERFAIGK